MGSLTEHDSIRAHEFDDKGRPLAYTMSDRELLEELVTKMRAAEDLMHQMANAAQSNPMLRAMLPKI